MGWGCKINLHGPKKKIDGRDFGLYGVPMNLKAMIRERGLTQRWVADRLGLDEARFGDVVRGRKRLPIEKIELLAALFGVEIAVVVQAAAASVRPPKPLGIDHEFLRR